MSEVRTERREAVGIVTIDRPEKRNALSPEVMEELAVAVRSYDEDPQTRCIVIAGDDQVFAAGADIKAMVERSLPEVLEASTLVFWKRLASCRTPLIAAVSGFALGGGCELALLCDMIVASETAEFGQPEITLGIIPGGGGTQRLARVIGKQRAMELVLTGRRINAQEAHSLGLVNLVAPRGKWLEQAIELAEVVARRPPLAVKMAKQAVLSAEEMPLNTGLDYERRLYELTMATEDRVEGMLAFLEKRRPTFHGR
jgi:enoyl-CoA hydratase/carnithine racemase